MRGLVIVLLLAIGGAAVFLWETQTEEGPVPGAVDVGGPGTPDSGEAAAVGRVDGRVGSAERTVAPAVDSLRPDEPVDPRAVQAEPSEPVAAKAVRVRGRVFDWQGRPVAAAKVGASDPGDQILGGAEWVDETLDWVLTDSEGRFEVGLKEQGAYRLIARAAKFPREVHTGRADAAVIDGVVITLRRPGAIAGRVLGVPAEEGADSIVVMARPVADGTGAAALIDLGGLMDSMGVAIGSHTATVEADGSFEVEGLDPKRQYTVWAARLGESTAVGGEAGEVATRIARGDAKGLPRPCTAPVTAQVEDRNVQLRYAPPTVVQFRVIDDATGAPIEGLSVAVGWMSVVKMIGMSVPIANPETLAQTEYPGGQVIVDRLPVRGADQPSNVAVQVSAPGYGMHDRENVEIRAGQNNDLGLIRLRRAPTVRVLVTAAGRPVRGARVSLRPEQEDRPRGSFSVSTSVPGGSSGRGAPSGLGGSQAREASAATHAAEPSVEEPLEEPLGEGSAEEEPPVDPLDRLLMADTDAEGRCELTFYEPGKYRVLAESPGLARGVTEPIEAPERGSIEQRIALTRGGTVLVSVVDARGATVPDIRVERSGPGGVDEETQSTIADGTARFESLAPGEHEFTLIEPRPGGEGGAGGLRFNISGLAGESVSQKVMVVAEQQAAVRLVVPTRCVVVGTVRVDGKPLERASVRTEAVAGEQDAKSAMASAFAAKLLGRRVAGLGDRGATDDEGAFRLEHVPVGERRIVLSHRSLQMPLHRTVQLREGENRIDFDLRLTTITGRVVDANGQPVRGARVSVYVPGAQTQKMRRALAAVQSTLGSVLGGADQVVRTGSDGAFELRGVRPGVPLEVRAAGRLKVPGMHKLDALQEGERRAGVELTLQVAGRVRITAGDGIVGVTAEWAGDDPAPPAGFAVVRNGRAMIDGLAPGSWRLVPERADDGDGQDAQVVTVVAGQTARVTL